MSSMTDWLQEAAEDRIRRSEVRRDDVQRSAHSRGGLLDLASNDYLDLAGDPRLCEAAIEAIQRFGTGARASRVVSKQIARGTATWACVIERGVLRAHRPLRFHVEPF